MTNYARIPDEMKSYRQWIVWRYEERDGEKPTKVPYDAKSGYLASVDDPNTWTDFATAATVATANGHFSGLGFVLTERDPFGFIDCDGTTDPTTLERQRKIYEAFDSYSERSPSGNGCHIIVKGHVQRGRKRSNVEVYSSLRYMTMTGDVVADKPIQERQQLFEVLWSEMGRNDPAYNGIQYDAPQTEEDNIILVRAMNAANGAKFRDLYSGNWQIHYPEVAAAGQGPSEADFALIDMLAFYTSNHEQIIRMFHASALGQRPKAQRKDYIQSMVIRAFDRMYAPVDFEMFQITAGNIIAAAQQALDWSTTPTVELQQWATSFNEMAAPGLRTDATNPAGHDATPNLATRRKGPIAQRGAPVNPFVFPPGLLGAFAQYIYESAPKPVPEIALAGAVGLMSGICGRSYQASNVAMNTYTLLIAETGTGKEGMASGIWQLLNSASSLIPSAGATAVPAMQQFVGPSDFRSDAALQKHLGTNPCFVSIQPEFGVRMEAMSRINAPSHLIGLKAQYLDLYHKADKNNRMSEMVYSDRTKNTASIYRPSFSLLGETTPEVYYRCCDPEHVEQGLMPRLSSYEYTGPRVPTNRNSNKEPPFDLVQALASMGIHCLTMMQQNKVVPIQFDQAADAAQQEYDTQIDDYINRSSNSVYRNLYNRAWLKVVKHAGLMAIGRNVYHPIIDLDCWNWAHDIVEYEIANTMAKFEAGEVGHKSSDDILVDVMKDLFVEYLTQPWEQILPYCQLDDGQQMHSMHVVPRSYISSKVAKRGVFRNAKAGINKAMYDALRQIKDDGLIAEFKANQFKFGGEATARFKGHGVIYVISDELAFTQHAKRKRFGTRYAG